MTIPDDFLVIHVPGNGFLHYFFHHLPSNQEEAHQPLVSILSDAIGPQ